MCDGLSSKNPKLHLDSQLITMTIHHIISLIQATYCILTVMIVATKGNICIMTRAVANLSFFTFESKVGFQMMLLMSVVIFLLCIALGAKHIQIHNDPLLRRYVRSVSEVEWIERLVKSVSLALAAAGVERFSKRWE